MHNGDGSGAKGFPDVAAALRTTAVRITSPHRQDSMLLRADRMSDPLYIADRAVDFVE